jgi:spore maturation protein CgeB
MIRIILKTKNIALEILTRTIKLFDLRSIDVLIGDDLKVVGDPNGKIILYVANKYDYADKNRGFGYEHYHFYLTLINSGYKIIYFPYDDLKQKYGRKKMSLMLREAVYYYQPEILLYFHFSDWVDHSVWKEISDELPTKTIIMLGDDYVRHEETRPIWEIFNIIVTMDAFAYEKRKKEGFSNVFLSQWGFNHFLYKDLNIPRIYDVTFIGQCYGKRPVLINELRKQGVNILTFGRGWPGSKRILQSDVIKIYNQSKIVFNSFLTAKDTIGINGRDFEASGCGGLCVTQDIEELKKFFIPGKEVITYKNIEDAAKKIKYYLSHDEERETISKNGHSRALLDHTYEKRFNEIFKMVDRKNE